MNPISRLTPATHRVLAAALIHERRFGKPMGESMIRRLCAAEGASLGACLTFILGLGIESDTGNSVRVGTGSSIRVPDDETEAALDWSEKYGDPAP